MAGKGKICWMCDTKGWAFENRAKAISSLLPDFEHEIRVLKSKESFDLNGFDIVVCDFFPRLKFICWGFDRKKILLGLRSFRAIGVNNGNT